MKTKRRHLRCVGCQDTKPREELQHVDALGRVCSSCIEVLDIVYEVELERLREARRAIQKFVADVRGGLL